MMCNFTDQEYLDDQDNFDDDRNEEPIGSCDLCSVNVYEYDAHEIDGDLYCDQCAWSIEQFEPSEP